MENKYFKRGAVRVCHSLSSYISYVFYAQFKLVLFKSIYNKQTNPFLKKNLPQKFGLSIFFLPSERQMYLMKLNPIVF